MLNIEKYREDLKEQGEGVLECNIQFLMGKNPYGCMRFDGCHACRKECIEWLCSEYKEPILNDAEREYLRVVIKPFRDEVRCIKKLSDEEWAEEYICICIEQSPSTNLPRFDEGMAYENMENGREYTIEELGL